MSENHEKPSQNFWDKMFQNCRQQGYGVRDSGEIASEIVSGLHDELKNEIKAGATDD